MTEAAEMPMAPELTVEELRNRLAENEALVDDLSDRLTAMRAERDANYKAGKEWEKQCVQLEGEVSRLKDELHALTIDKARLEGYVDRAREFDPKPEPVMVPLQQNVESRNIDWYGTTRDRPAPWYRRNIG